MERVTPVYKRDDISVGQVMRWINAEVMKAGHAGDYSGLDSLMESGSVFEDCVNRFIVSTGRPDYPHFPDFHRGSAVRTGKANAKLSGPKAPL